MNWNQAKNDFELYMKIERGLSKNTIENYLRDLQKFVDFLKNPTHKKKPDKCWKR